MIWLFLYKIVRNLKRLVLGMKLPVVSQMILPSESFATNITRVRPFVSVGPLVYQQIVTFSKLSIAKFADELFFWARAPAVARKG